MTPVTLENSDIESNHDRNMIAGVALTAAALAAAVLVATIAALTYADTERGRELLSASGLEIIPAESLADAAEKVVAAVAAGGAGQP